MKKILTAMVALAIPVSYAGAQGNLYVSPEDRARAMELVSEMTLEEKIDYIGGFDSFYIRPVDRLGIPMIKMADGPQGVRNNTRSTLYPSGIASASTWNRSLVYSMGEALGADARARGVHILLGPGINLYKMPLCGRNFEYFGEDPYLAGEIAASYIRGLQSRGVMACVKHFAVNNLEWGRHVVSADVDERTLNELYLPAFEKAVKEAGTGAVMDSYNLVNSVHSTENGYLNIDILRDRWGFEGILMSDWTATYSTIGAVNNGLDLEMPKAIMMTKEKILPLVEAGVIDEAAIDRKVLHILQTLIAFGFFDRPQLDESLAGDTSFQDSVALAVAREAVVMLKNDGGILPFRKGRLVLCGPNVDKEVKGGGSGNVYPEEYVTLAEGFSNMGRKVRTEVFGDRTDLSGFFADRECSEPGVKVEYFDNKDLSGAPASVSVADRIDFNFGKGSPAEGKVGHDAFSARYTFYCVPDEYGGYFFTLGGDDGYRMFIDGKKVIDDWTNHSFRSRTCHAELSAGDVHEIVVEYYDNASDASVRLSYSGIGRKEAEAISEADAVVVSLGFDSSNEKENSDRTFSLPEGQVSYLEKVASLNGNVIAVINSGGGVEMAPWIDKVKAVLMAWYPGQEGGTALAEIISGRVSPSGKLPVSIERRLEDNPSYGSYFENTERVRSYNPYSRVAYNDGLFTGYRGYDRSGTCPLFEFGYGMSYSSFEYSGIMVEKDEGGYAVSFDVTNTGGCDAAETVQLYVSDTESSLIRPEKELKGYEKVFLRKGETERVKILLGEEAFRFYDPARHGFVVEPGEFRISVGASSEDIRLKADIIVD